jgi:hypothetical protein
MPQLVAPLPDGPLDIIGDVHGEIDALRALLGRLGADVDRATVTRPLVFVGDLIDRGPDSAAVVALVRRFVEAGVAQCVVGNHELNVLQADHKEGNGWFFGHNDGYPWRTPGGPTVRRPFDSREVTSKEDREGILAFLATLPVALERDDLRVVHADWDHEALRALPPSGDVASLADDAEQAVLAELARSGALARAERERQHFADLRDPDVRPDRMLVAVQEVSAAEQLRNPFRVLTSGREVPVSLDEVFFVGGKWRFVTRARWWDGYDDGPAVVVGHYWRRRGGAVRGKVDLWDKLAPFAWGGPRGNVLCVDYSVGRRFVERWGGSAGPFVGGLAALRWPERVLVFDDVDGATPTTGFGG